MDAIQQKRDSSLARMFREQLDLQNADVAGIARVQWLQDEAHRLFVHAEDNPDSALGALTVIVATLVKKCESYER